MKLKGVDTMRTSKIQKMDDFKKMEMVFKNGNLFQNCQPHRNGIFYISQYKNSSGKYEFKYSILIY